MSMTLAGGATTQSRGRRPLPRGAVSARTIGVRGASEAVAFVYPHGRLEYKQLLSWVGGQSGLLWGGGPFPFIQSDPDIAHGSYGHAAEYALADALGEALDGVFTSDALSCRFFQDGGTALAAAARVARHATGRRSIASYGYHGAAMEWAHAPALAGQPLDNAHIQFEWGDTEWLRSDSAHCAAICVEVPPVPDAEARAFLAECRAACDAGGALFILDEVVTGFRFGLQGAAGRYGVKPDIATYGKAMSAVGCVSAIVGRRDLVDLLAEPVFYSTTFGGAPGPCGIAAATVRYLIDHAPQVYEHLDTIGAALQDGFNALGLNCVGQPERSVLKFDTDAEWLAFCGAMIERGVMIHRPQFSTLAHTLADVELTLDYADHVTRGLPVVSLEGRTA